MICSALQGYKATGRAGPAHSFKVFRFTSRTLLLLLLSLTILLPGASFAADPARNPGAPESRTVKATGYGTLSGSNIVEARNLAIADALRKAVEQAIGSVVSSETMVESYRVLKETVYTRSEGFIRSYEILNEMQGESTYTVTLSAVVETGAIMDDLDRTGIAYARAGRPRVLFMLSETLPGLDAPLYWWKEGAKSGVTNKTESALKESFLDSGFTVIDPGVFKGPVAGGGDNGYGKTLSGNGITSIAARLNAQLVIKGNASVTLGPQTPGSPLKLYMAEITASAVRADTAEVLAHATARVMLKHVSDTLGPELAIKQAANKLSDELIAKITVRWAEPATVVLRLSGVADYEEAVNLKWLLKRRVAGVKAVYQKGFEGGVAYFELHSDLSADSVASEITRLLSLSYRVTGTTSNTIDLIAVEEK